MLDNRAHIFIHVARTLNITRAAQDLYISQPTVTAAIKKLEDHYGVKLFIRYYRGLELTPAGVLLYRHLKDMQDNATRLENDMMQLKGTIHGKLMLGASPTFGDYLLPHLLGQFKSTHPHISYTLDIGNNRYVYALLQEGKIELAFLAGRLPGKRLTIRKIMQDELVLITSHAHPWSKRPAIEKSELLEYPLVLRERGSGSRKDIEETLSEIGISPDELTVIAEFHSLEGIKSAVEANLGAALVSRWAVVKELKLETISAVRLNGINLYRDIYVATLPDVRLTEAASRLLAITEMFSNKTDFPAGLVK